MQNKQNRAGPCPWELTAFSLGQPGAPGLSWGSESNPQLALPITPTENRLSRRQVSESWTTCPFLLCISPPDLSQAVVTRPVAELCGLPEITAAPWRAVVSLFPVSSGRQRCSDKRKPFQWFIIYIIFFKFSFLPSVFSFSFSTFPWLLP